MTHETVARTAILTHRLNATRARDFAVLHLAANFGQVLGTDGWTELAGGAHPDLLQKVHKRLAERMEELARDGQRLEDNYAKRENSIGNMM